MKYTRREGSSQSGGRILMTHSGTMQASGTTIGGSSTSGLPSRTTENGPGFIGLQIGNVLREVPPLVRGVGVSQLLGRPVQSQGSISYVNRSNFTPNAPHLIEQNPESSVHLGIDQNNSLPNNFTSTENVATNYETHPPNSSGNDSNFVWIGGNFNGSSRPVVNGRTLTSDIGNISNGVNIFTANGFSSDTFATGVNMPTAIGMISTANANDVLSIDMLPNDDINSTLSYNNNPGNDIPQRGADDNEVPNQSQAILETQRCFVALQKYIPFVLILLAKGERIKLHINGGEYESQMWLMLQFVTIINFNI